MISIVIDLCLRQDKSIIHVEVCYFSLSSSSLTRNKQKKSYTVKSHNTKIFIRKPECIKCHLHLIVIRSDTLYSPVEIQATLNVADKEERRSLS